MPRETKKKSKHSTTRKSLSQSKKPQDESKHLDFSITKKVTNGVNYEDLITKRAFKGMPKEEKTKSSALKGSNPAKEDDESEFLDALIWLLDRAANAIEGKKG